MRINVIQRTILAAAAALMLAAGGLAIFGTTEARAAGVWKSEFQAVCQPWFAPKDIRSLQICGVSKNTGTNCIVFATKEEAWFTSRYPGTSRPAVFRGFGWAACSGGHRGW